MLRATLLLSLLASLNAVDVQLGELNAAVYVPEDRTPVGLLVWFHSPQSDAQQDADWWKGRGLTERGLAVVAPRCPANSWQDLRDRIPVMELLRLSQEHTKLTPAEVILGGEGNGAGFAMRLACDFQTAVCGGALLARGFERSGWRDATDSAPIFGLYGNANDSSVPMTTVRSLSKRLRKAGYQVHVESALAGKALDPVLAELLGTVATKMGIRLRPGTWFNGRDAVIPLEPEARE
ncbi:MAG: hypothetical protein PF961_08290 [Planctomycetota bacterium]|nr:hypothetical protein [Planctomycetota bacterium]